jgi:tellurite resistance protein TerC
MATAHIVRVFTGIPTEGPWFWIAFTVFVLALLAFDQFVVHRGGRRLPFRYAILLTIFWIALAAVFAVAFYFWRGKQPALEFVTAYVIEESLSADNLFVFLIVFRYFAVPRQYQRKVLSWGIIGALVMRGIFIVAGIALIRYLHWIIYVFGVLLLYAGVRLLRRESAIARPEDNWLLRLTRRFIPVTKDFAGGRFFIRAPHLMATPLLLVLIVIESTDLLFATDSIPAVLAISRDPFVIFTSNVFAILGLRALYFTVAGLIEAFHLLHYGLAAILVFVGGKMLLSAQYEIPTHISLLVVAAILAISIVASLLIRSDDRTMGSSEHP